MNQGSAVSLQDSVSRWRTGDRLVRDEMVQRTCEQLRRLTHKLLKGFPGVKRWEQTDDVFQNAMIRLLQAIQSAKPTSLQHFLSLGALQIRRELLDLRRHYCGPEGIGANHASNAGQESDETPLYDRADEGQEPRRLAEWFEFHERVDGLPEKEREVIDLLYYHGMTQAEAAEVLGVTVKTVQNRRSAAFVRIYEGFKGEPPISE